VGEHTEIFFPVVRADVESILSFFGLEAIVFYTCIDCLEDALIATMIKNMRYTISTFTSHLDANGEVDVDILALDAKNAGLEYLLEDPRR